MKRLFTFLFLLMISFTSQTFGQQLQPLLPITADRYVAYYNEPITFTVHGGIPPYQWNFQGGSPPFLVDGGDTFVVASSGYYNLPFPHCVFVRDSANHEGEICVTIVPDPNPTVFYSGLFPLTQEKYTGLFGATIGWLSPKNEPSFMSVRDPLTLKEKLFSTAENVTQTTQPWIAQGYSYRFTLWHGDSSTWTGKPDSTHWSITDKWVVGPDQLKCSPAEQEIYINGAAPVFYSGGDPQDIHISALGGSSVAGFDKQKEFLVFFDERAGGKTWTITIYGSGMSANCQVTVKNYN